MRDGIEHGLPGLPRRGRARVALLRPGLRRELPSRVLHVPRNARRARALRQPPVLQHALLCEACARLCENCSEACLSKDSDAVMRNCATICRDRARACRDMASMRM